MEEREKALELENRKKIYLHISKFPGSYLREIQKALQLETGVLQYHLGYLEKKGLITVKEERYRKRYFPAGKIPYGDKDIISLLRQRILRRIVVYVLLNPRATYNQIAAQFTISHSTFSYHLKKLLESNVIKQIKEGAEPFYEVADEDKIAKILITYKSSFLDDVVDRFVDAWLELHS
ncbi:MAG: winged helix-turn-helix transcriptional regulator [Candidatus Thermoplasmatota archaeon]